MTDFWSDRFVRNPQNTEEALSLITAGIGALASNPDVSEDYRKRIKAQADRLNGLIEGEG